MIIEWEQLEMKERETYAGNISPSLSSKRAIVSLYEKLTALTPPCFGKAEALVSPLLSPASTPFGEASRTHQNRAERSST